MVSVNIRTWNKSDLNFILSTWLRSFRHSSPMTKHLGSDIYYAFHEKVLKHTLAKSNTTVLIATPENDPEVILGYMVVELTTDPIIHFTYVKKAFRRFGIAKSLLAAAELDGTIQITHWTFDCEWIIKKYPQMVYNLYRM